MLVVLVSMSGKARDKQGKGLKQQQVGLLFSTYSFSILPGSVVELDPWGDGTFRLLCFTSVLVQVFPYSHKTLTNRLIWNYTLVKLKLRPFLFR